MDETDAVVEAWAADLTRAEIFAATAEHKIPSAPVRDLHEVLANEHLLGRGMIEPIDHPQLGRISVPGSPVALPRHPANPRHSQPGDRRGHRRRAGGAAGAVGGRCGGAEGRRGGLTPGWPCEAQGGPPEPFAAMGR